MQVTRETDYAVRCVLYLSERSGEVVMVPDIARAKDIPRSFLAKILQKLTKAKIVRSYRGIRGGFMLARKPVDISLLDVIKAIEGPLAMNRCVVDRKSCRFRTACAVHPVWVDVKRELEDSLRTWNFERLLQS